MSDCAGTWRSRKFFIRAFIPAQLAIVVNFCAVVARAQINSWTSPTNGNWEAASWSLGTIPGTNQDILLTNAGWKAVQIAPSTVQNFPQSLNVRSIEISSPTNSFNTLLLNYAGFQAPLTVQAVSVESNSAMTMLFSALQLNGGNGVGLQVGGAFNQNDSIVAGRQINVGYIGPGVYNMNSGFLAVSNLWVGGSFGGVFNQNGGTNAVGITDVEGGTYNFHDGYFGATIYFDSGGQFRQQGGLLNSDLTIFRGAYTLEGGVHQGSITVPSRNGFTAGSGSALQTGGTNYGALYVGTVGFGSYSLSNAVSYAGSLSVGFGGSFSQWNGMQTVTGMVSVTEEQINFGNFAFGSINLNSGQFSCAGMFLGGHYSQSGGTNIIAGDMTMTGTHASFSLSGGLMTANNITVNPSWVGIFFQSGGTLIVTNTLSIGGTDLPAWQGFAGGGQLIVSNITLTPGAIFSCGNAQITQSGTVTSANARLSVDSGSPQFGSFVLGNGGSTNSSLTVYGLCAVRFANSSSMTWSNDALLIVENWNGSLFGGGQQRIVFGNNSAGLTTQQRSKIQFHNPAGLAAGTYPAKMLSTGEIVPDSGAPLAAQMSAHKQTNGMQIVLQGQAGRSYRFEVSTDLVHWQPWMTQLNSGGTISLADTQTTNIPVRFYRAALLP